jgi:hypothetical protein
MKDMLVTKKKYTYLMKNCDKEDMEGKSKENAFSK